jgi:large subunit ribosomal protein L6
MSRIGKKIINIPEGVEAKDEKGKISIKGPKGTLEFSYNPEMKVILEKGSAKVEKAGNSKNISALWGTTVRLIENMIAGVTQGFEKQLELNGVGYRMNLAGKKITMALGFSHPVEVETPEGIEVKIENNVMKISGIDKQQVGQFAANIRSLKPVEPYKGKGFRYVGEIVRRKEGKKSVASK